MKENLASEPQLLSSKNLNKTVLTLAIPAIVEMLLQMTVGLADTAMVGRIGAGALAAVGLGNQIIMLLATILGAIGTGNTALVARYTGANDREQAGKVARQSVFLAIIIALIVGTTLLVFGESILGFFFRTTEPEVISLAADYIRILALALVFNYLLMLINATLRGAGDTKTPMKITAIVNLINIVGNAFLIFGLGPFPQLGVQGAAIATAFAQFCGGILALNSLLRSKNISVSFRNSLKLDFKIIKRIFNIGVPAAIEQGSLRIGQLLYTVIIASLGTVSYAAHQVALNAESISFNPGFGFALAATTLVGQNLGAGNLGLAEKSGHRASQMAMIFMSIMGVIFFIFSKQIVYIFTPDQDVVELASICLRIVALSQPALAAQMVYSGALRGAGDTKGILWITLSGFLVVRVGLTYWMAIYLNFGLIGAWVAMGIDLYYRSILMFARFRKGNWQSLQI